MGRGQTTEEFMAAHGRPDWYYYGGNPGDPGWVSYAAREIGDRNGLDAEELADEAEAFGWEFHDPGYRGAVEEAAVRLKGRRS
jgi:hypothetical protein